MQHVCKDAEIKLDSVYSLTRLLMWKPSAMCVSSFLSLDVLTGCHVHRLNFTSLFQSGEDFGCNIYLRDQLDTGCLDIVKQLKYLFYRFCFFTNKWTSSYVSYRKKTCLIFFPWISLFHLWSLKVKWSNFMVFEATAGQWIPCFQKEKKKKEKELLLEIHLILGTGRRINQSRGEALRGNQKICSRKIVVAVDGAIELFLLVVTKFWVHSIVCDIGSQRLLYWSDKPKVGCPLY